MDRQRSNVVPSIESGGEQDMQSGTSATSATDLLNQVLDDLNLDGFQRALVREPSRDGRGLLEADLLVTPESLARVEAYLERLGFARRPAWGRRPHRFHVRPITGSGAIDWLKIDLVTDLCFGRWHEFTTDSAARCLGHPGRTDLDRLAPADELLALLGHALLDGGGLTPVARARLVALAPHASQPGVLAERLAPPDAGRPSWKEILGSIQAQRWPEVEAMASELGRRLADDRCAVAVRRLSNRSARHSVKLLTAVGGRGPVVALVGPDGTGKSTLAAAVSHSVAMPARVLYGGTYRSGTVRRQVPGLTTLIVAGRLLATRVELDWHRVRGRLVVLDRHPVEVRPQPTDVLSARSRLRRRFLASTLRAPDLLIALDAPALLLHERRPEHAVEQLEEDRQRHLALVEQTEGSEVIDAAASADAVRNQTVELVWNRVVVRAGSVA